MAKRKKRSNELLNDYFLLDKMSKDLKLHQSKIKSVAKRISRINTNMKYRLIDNLEIVMDHMKKAERETQKAKEKLKRI